MFGMCSCTKPKKETETPPENKVEEALKPKNMSDLEYRQLVSRAKDEAKSIMDIPSTSKAIIRENGENIEVEWPTDKTSPPGTVYSGPSYHAKVTFDKNGKIIQVLAGS